MTGTRRGASRSLLTEVSSAFRVMTVALFVVTVLTSATLFWSHYFYGPKVIETRRVVTLVERTHVAMIDVETSLRAYFLVKENQFLDPYNEAELEIRESLAELDGMELGGDLARDSVQFRVTQQAWWDQWASRALFVAFEDRSDTEVRDFLDLGRTLFDDYRVAHDAFAASATTELEHTTSRQSVALGSLLTSLTVLAVLTAGFTISRRRRLLRRVVRPVSALRGTVDAVAAGRLDPPPHVEAADEIVALRDGLARMTEALDEQRRTAAEQLAHTDRMARRLQEVVTFARTMSGSLSLHHVLETAATVVRSAADARAVRIWLVDPEDAELHLAYDTATGRAGRLVPAAVRLGEDVVGGVAQSGERAFAMPTATAPARAVLPLIVGARVAGVVEVVDPRADEDPELVAHVESFVGHAAAAIVAARLYQQTERLSTLDGLTGLSNRRRFDEDLARETDLALRHARRLAFIMLDLDHFKAVNDTYGHQRGDQVLQEVGAVLRNEARSSDYVYRYGGEEFAILVAESDAASAALVAERVRSAVEEHFAAVGVRQTVSCGVASLPEHATSAEALVAAADAALYVAKQLGRNRVAVAGPSQGRPVGVGAGPVVEG